MVTTTHPPQPALPTGTADAAATARSFLNALAADATEAHAEPTVAHALAIADLVELLGVDRDVVAASMLYPLMERGLVSKRKLASVFSNEVMSLVRELVRLGSFGFPEGWTQDKGLNAAQAEALRKMLIAIIEDVRLVLVRLAVQTQRLREAKDAPDDLRRRLAMETREIYAPLANKLGVWQLKWELEDLAFRYLEPDVYKQVASWLQERRVDREAYIENVLEILRTELGKQNIQADIEGRPKHIFSIWKKMRRKQVDFNNVFDVRAVRILTDSVADCYAALGIVHGKWSYIPGEFDDYIATPKENMYRSLHTAVIGPENKALEVQIRTHEMHEHAELGVAAHWKYKEGSGAGDDASFERKINWLRQILDPGDDEDSGIEFIDRVRSEIFEDRVYALTPGGDIIDLPRGATPLDFAYFVHTDLGHRCKGAKIGGRIVPLTYQIANGDQVDIIAGKTPNPSRDWLVPSLGYLASTRARSKVRVWFRRQDQQHNLEQGRVILERELSRLGVKAPHVNILARDLHQNSATDLYRAIGNGDVTATEIANAVQQRLEPQVPPTPEIKKRRSQPETSSGKGGVEVEGVGDLMTNFAQCCKPVPPDPIAGYITQGRGITIHRSDCPSLQRLVETSPERILSVSWGGARPATYPVDITLEAFDRQGLVKDVSTLTSAEKINIVTFSTTTNRKHLTARMELTVEIAGLDELSRLLHKLGQLPNVIDVHRKT
ncbi:MAG: GTP diphosphokinase [Pseudomonadota bacterium]